MFDPLCRPMELGELQPLQSERRGGYALFDGPVPMVQFEILQPSGAGRGSSCYELTHQLLDLGRYCLKPVDVVHGSCSGSQERGCRSTQGGRPVNAVTVGIR